MHGCFFYIAISRLICIAPLADRSGAQVAQGELAGEARLRGSCIAPLANEQSPPDRVLAAFHHKACFPSTSKVSWTDAQKKRDPFVDKWVFGEKHIAKEGSTRFMFEHEYINLDATDIAKLIADKEISAEEAMNAAIAQIERTNPTLNAVIDFLYERAKEQLKAGLPEGPFHGVPFLIKASLPVKDLRYTLGSVVLKDNLSKLTAPLAKRMEDSGLNFIGITNMSELGLLPFTEPELYGACKNPWNLKVSTGGSSGGTASAVAARMVPMAHGADGGGSIRIPAAACGIFGLKPGRGRNPRTRTDSPDGFVCHHVLTQSVRDSAKMLDITAGAEPGDRWQLPRPERPYAEIIESDPAPLRIGFQMESLTGTQPHPDCVEGMEKTIALLKDLGHEIIPVAPNIDGNEYNEGFRVLWCQSVGYVLRNIQTGISENTKIPGPLRYLLKQPWILKLFLRMYKTDGHAQIEHFTKRLMDIDATYTPADVWIAWDKMRKADYAFEDLFEDVDLYLTPVLQKPPLPLHSINQRWPEKKLEEFLMQYAGYTTYGNTTGLPGMSVPLHWNKDDVPVGSHFLAPTGREDRLLQLAAQLERAQPWRTRYPDLIASQVNKENGS